MVFRGGLGREFGSSADFPLGFGLGGGLASSGSDVDKVLVEKDVKRYVRHLGGSLSPVCDRVCRCRNG